MPEQYHTKILPRISVIVIIEPLLLDRRGMRFVTVCTFCASRNGPEGRCVLIHRYFYTVYITIQALKSKKMGITTQFSRRSRRIPLNIRAMIAKIIYWKTTHSTVTFWILFETSHFNSYLQVTPRLNPQAFSRKINVKSRKNVLKWAPFCFELTWSVFSIKIWITSNSIFSPRVSLGA